MLLLVSVMPLPDLIDLPIPNRATYDEDADKTEAGTLLLPRQSLAKVFKDLYEWEKLALTQYLASVASRVVGAGTPAIAERTRVLDGDAAKEILRAGAEDGADLIVMSTRGRSGLACLWPGSVAMNVVRETALPVLLVHEQRARHLEPPQQREEHGDHSDVNSQKEGPAGTSA